MKAGNDEIGSDVGDSSSIGATSSVEPSRESPEGIAHVQFWQGEIDAQRWEGDVDVLAPPDGLGTPQEAAETPLPGAEHSPEEVSEEFDLEGSQEAEEPMDIEEHIEEESEEVPTKAIQMTKVLLEKIESIRPMILELPDEGEIREQANAEITHCFQIVFQYLRAGLVIPVDEVRERLQMVSDNMEAVRRWPKEPLDVPHAPAHGSCAYFEHPHEGRIKLMWANPLPCPGIYAPSYQCDVCMQDIQAAWQHVCNGEERDTSHFIENRVGWDVCAQCFREAVLKEHQHLHDTMRQTFTADPASPRPLHRNVCRSPLYSGQVITKMQTLATMEGIRVQLEVPLTGEYLFCMALPEACLPEPEHWGAAAVKVLYNVEHVDGDDAPDCSICLDPLTDTTDGRIRPVVTKCGHYFHEFCLRKQLRGIEGGKRIGRCPLCRQEDPLQMKGRAGVPTALEFSITKDHLQHDFVAGREYAVLCIMAADKDLPLESYSVACVQSYTHCPVPAS
jgi:hypothetical protein